MSTAHGDGRNRTRPDASFLGADFRYWSFSTDSAGLVGRLMSLCPESAEAWARPGALRMAGACDSNSQTGAWIMRYELADYEWVAIKPMLPNKPRGVPRVSDRRVLDCIFWVLRSGAPAAFGP